MNGPVLAATTDDALLHWATELNTVLIGQGAVTEALLIALISGGHVLLEGPPGVGKGLITRALAASFGATFTPLPCPVTAVGNRLGHTGAPLPTGEVVGVSGLENASPGGQAALQFALQATDEHTLAQPGAVHAPCLFVASRNLLDPMGAVALGQALLDRFMLAVAVPFPGQDDEARLVREVGLSTARDMLDVVSPQALFTAAQVTALQAKRRTITVDEQLVNYAVRLVRATRFTPHLSQGAGPRAAIALVRYAQARALLQGRAYANAQDIKQGAPAVLRHRVRAAAAQRLQGVTLEDTLAEVINQVTAPRP